MEDAAMNKNPEPMGSSPAVPPAAALPVQAVKPAGLPQLTIDDFKKIELKVARIKTVADHPNADKLYVLTIDVGDTTKQIVAGIKRGYTKEELIDKYVVVVNNLKPAVLRGVESQGMLLAASDNDCIALLSPEKAIKPGSVVK